MLGAVDLLRSLGAGEIVHPGGVLLDHLVRVRELTHQWGGSVDLQRAALCHAAYGTDGFAHPLLGLHQRGELQAVIGSPAEALVYCYGSVSRLETYRAIGSNPLVVHDRFTGSTTAIEGELLEEFAILTIANELDVARTADLNPAERTGIRNLVGSLRVHASDVAERALLDEALRSVS